MEVEGSNQRWREAMRGGGEQKEEEGSNQRWQAQEAIRTACAGRGAVSQCWLATCHAAFLPFSAMLGSISSSAK